MVYLFSTAQAACSGAVHYGSCMSLGPGDLTGAVTVGPSGPSQIFNYRNSSGIVGIRATSHNQSSISAVFAFCNAASPARNFNLPNSQPVSTNRQP
jgi:hypothetical protein